MVKSNRLLVTALQPWGRKTLSIRKGPKSFVFHPKRTPLLNWSFSNEGCVSRLEHGRHSGNNLPFKNSYQSQVSRSPPPLHNMFYDRKKCGTASTADELHLELFKFLLLQKQSFRAALLTKLLKTPAKESILSYRQVRVFIYLMCF